ncbi:MAG: GGDEF domain-containing protein [Myxococcales bacterium]|nr:GGDEF domain-containing protein [Myxococcales bacterium]
MPDQPIVTLAPDEVARFLLRHRRSETLERYEPRLDRFLREILARANQFVPSDSGAFLLDDPRAKLFGASEDTRLTCIAAFGSSRDKLLGESFGTQQGFIGEVYSRALPKRASGQAAADAGVESLLAVPVHLGTSVCGVLELVNRQGSDFSDKDQSLLEIFAGYISSSVQNTLDAIRSRELARRDHLTGLYNDRYFHYRLREEMRRAVAQSTPVSLLFIDLDEFKSINDRHGHLVGSRTLHEVGLLLSQSVPPGAVTARYGGDEFVVILPQTGVERARDVGDQLRQRVAQAEVVEASPTERVTMSIGIACFADADASSAQSAAERANELIRAADAAMYEAKARGRDNVMVATGAVDRISPKERRATSPREQVAQEKDR